MSDQTEFPSTYQGVVQLVKRLRGPNGCPWDRQQTRQDLKPQLLEECYELIEAIEEGDTRKLVEELGDVLFHMAFQVELAEEQGEFTQEQVFRLMLDKLVRRHPHVFGDAQVSSADEAVQRWQALKQQERDETEESILDGVPRQMPALAYAQAIQERAARTGFEWDDFHGVLEKVAEEVEEIERTESQQEREMELGDLLFSLVNASRWMGVDAEGALRLTNTRFYRRFTEMERLSRQRGLSFPDLPLDQKEALWQEAKRLESGE